MRLPNEYQEVEYIKSEGTQYINTGLTANFNTKVEFEFMSMGTTNSGFIYGSRNSNSKDTHTCILFPNAKDWYPQFANNTTAVHLIDTHPELAQNNIRYKIINSKDGFYINNTLIKTYNETKLNSSYPMYICALNHGGTVENRTANGRLYNFKIYDNNVLIRDFVPCYRKSDNEIGLYDLINNIFYTNAGTGTFLKGNNVYYTADKLSYLRETKSLLKDKINDLTGEITDESTFAEYAEAIENLYDDLPKVSGDGTEVTLANVKAGKMKAQPLGNTSQAILPSEYQQVEYIESTGTQYIDTGIITNLNEVYWYVKFELTELKGESINGYNLILGKNSYPQIAAYNNGWTVGNAGSNLPYPPQINLKYEATLNKNGDGGLNIDGQATSISRFENSVIPRIFDKGENASKAKIYNVKYIRLSDNVVLNNFIPCYRKNDNEIGIYDAVNNIFYTNNGTGTFLKGNDVPNPSYPQEIKNVTGDNNVVIRGKNLFDFNTWLNFQSTRIVHGTYISSDSNSITISATADDCYTYYGDAGLNIKVKGNTAYTLQCVKELIEGTNVVGSAYLFEYDSSGNLFKYTSLGNDTVLNFTTQINTRNIRIRFGILFTDNTVKFSNIMLLEGTYTSSTIPDYEPYITPIEKELKLSGKNLAYTGWAEDFVERIESTGKAEILTKDNRNSLKYRADAGYQEYDTKYLFKTDWKENTQYTFSMYINISQYTNLTIEYTDNTTQAVTNVSTTNQWVYISFTSQVNKTIKFIRCLYAGGFTYIDLDTFMVEEGTTATPYEPYYNYTLMKDDYITEDCVIHHKRGKVILDEKADIGNITIRTNTTRFTSLIRGKKPNVSTECNVYINRNTQKPPDYYWSRDEIGICELKNASNGSMIFSLDNTIVYDKTTIQNWLSTHNTIVEYELAEETTETIPNTIPLYNQIKDLFNIQNSNAGTLIVETESNEENARLKIAATALQSWEVNS